MLNIYIYSNFTAINIKLQIRKNTHTHKLLIFQHWWRGPPQLKPLSWQGKNRKKKYNSECKIWGHEPAFLPNRLTLNHLEVMY